jgi:hypothetical protein
VAVQHGKDGVHILERAEHLRPGEQPLTFGLDHRERSITDPLQRCRRLLRRQPRAGAGDRERYNIEPIAVEETQHRPAGDHRDGVLARSATEEHGDAEFRHERLVPSPGPSPTLWGGES